VDDYLFSAAYLASWTKAFVLTQVVEAPIYRRVANVPWWAALAPSALTHPFVWFLFPRLRALGVSYLGMAAAAEAFAWLVEAGFLVVACKLPPRRALAVSLLANATSVVVGLGLRALGLL